jgi:hypothetical protein
LRIEAAAHFGKAELAFASRIRVSIPSRRRPGCGTPALQSQIFIELFG